MRWWMGIKKYQPNGGLCLPPGPSKFPHDDPVSNKDKTKIAHSALSGVQWPAMIYCTGTHLNISFKGQPALANRDSDTYKLNIQ